MAELVRLMPRFDADWRRRLAEAEARRWAVLGGDGALSEAQRLELAAAERDIDAALASRFRTTADYRDHYYAKARAFLEAEGILMTLPALPDDATVEEIDAVLASVWRAVEVTNSETF